MFLILGAYAENAWSPNKHISLWYNHAAMSVQVYTLTGDYEHTGVPYHADLWTQLETSWKWTVT